MIKSRVIAALAMSLSLVLGLSAPALAGPTPKPSKFMTDAEKDLAFNSYLDQLVAKGVMSPAYAEFLAGAMREKRDDRQAKVEAYAARADQIIAENLGMTVERFRELRATRSLPVVTAEQRLAIRTKLRALAFSLGLPKRPLKPTK